MDRRLFNKTLAALIVGPHVLCEPVESHAAASLSGRALPSLYEDVRGHYGITNVDITSSFELEQTFVLGQLEIFEDYITPTETEFSFSFYLTKEREKGAERTVYFKGKHINYINFVDTPVLHAHEEVSKTAKIVYVYQPGTKDRVPAKKIEKNKCYDIHLLIYNEPEKPPYEVVLADYKVIDYCDWENNNDIDIQR